MALQGSRESQKVSRVDDSPAGQRATGSTAPVVGGPQRGETWSVAAHRHITGQALSGHAEIDIKRRGSRHIAAVAVFGDSPVTTPDGISAEDRARYIVAAANAYPELIAFVRRVGYEPIGHAESSCHTILGILTDEARALLAKVEVK